MAPAGVTARFVAGAAGEVAQLQTRDQYGNPAYLMEGFVWYDFYDLSVDTQDLGLVQVGAPLWAGQPEM